MGDVCMSRKWSRTERLEQRDPANDSGETFYYFLVTLNNQFC